MQSRTFILRETSILALGQVICVGAMFGIFALLHSFDRYVLIGGIVGAVLAILNFFFLAVGADLAADKATEQDVKGGKALIRSSYTIRLAVLALVLFAFAKSGLCNPFSLVLPLVFSRPILIISQFFRKSGDNNA